MGLQPFIKQVKIRTEDFLTYNRTEQRGIVVLGLILIVLFTINALIPSGTVATSPDFSRFQKEVAAFEQCWRRAEDSDSMARIRKTMKFKSRYSNFSYDSGRTFQSHNQSVIMIELNSADTLDLQQLRGIGPGFARRIVNYRHRLRGYHHVNQLLEVFGMDTARYNMIEKYLTVNSDSVHPLELNTVTFKELLSHPYFPFPITKQIMIYRQKNKMFRSLDELKRIVGVNDSLYRLMILYVRLSP